MKGIGSRDFFTAIEKELPPVFSRDFASKVIGGLISTKTMSNEDSLGKGPREKIRVGSKVGYTKESFMQWLKQKGYEENEVGVPLEKIHSKVI